MPNPVPVPRLSGLRSQTGTAPANWLRFLFRRLFLPRTVRTSFFFTAFRRGLHLGKGATS